MAQNDWKLRRIYITTATSNNDIKVHYGVERVSGGQARDVSVFNARANLKSGEGFKAVPIVEEGDVILIDELGYQNQQGIVIAVNVDPETETETAEAIFPIS